MSAFHPLQTLALAVAPAEADAVTILNEARSLALMPQVPERLLPALFVVIDSPSDEPPHFVISENHVVRFIYGDAELLARPLHQLDEVSVLELHCRLLCASGNI